MTLAKHNYHTAALIPSHIDREAVLAALHDHNTCISLQALTSSHEPLPTTDPTTLKDTFWYPPDTYPTSSYLVTEIITFLPWFSWGKYPLSFPAVFQSTPQGLKTRADTGGVVLRAEFRVMEGSKIESVVEGEGEGLGDVKWVLVEDVEVVCPWWMMPIVRGKMEEAHRDICRLVVEKVVKMRVEKELADSRKEVVERSGEVEDLQEMGVERKGDEREVERGEVVVPAVGDKSSAERVDSPTPPPKAAREVSPLEEQVPDKITYA